MNKDELLAEITRLSQLHNLDFAESLSRNFELQRLSEQLNSRLAALQLIDMSEEDGL